MQEQQTVLLQNAIRTGELPDNRSIRPVLVLNQNPFELAVGITEAITSSPDQRPLALLPVYADRGLGAAFLLLQESGRFQGEDLFFLYQLATLATSQDRNISRLRRKALNIRPDDDPAFTLAPIDVVDPVDASVLREPSAITQHPVFIDLLKGDAGVLAQVVRAIRQTAAGDQVVLPDSLGKKALSMGDIRILARNGLLVPDGQGHAAGWAVYLQHFQGQLSTAGIGRDRFIFMPFETMPSIEYDKLKAETEGALDGRKPRHFLASGYDEFLTVAGGLAAYTKQAELGLVAALHEVRSLTGQQLAIQLPELRDFLIVFQTGMGNELRSYEGKTEPIYQAALLMLSGIQFGPAEMQQLFIDHLIFTARVNQARQAYGGMSDQLLGHALRMIYEDQKMVSDLLAQIELRFNKSVVDFTNVTIGELLAVAVDAQLVDPSGPLPGSQGAGQDPRQRRAGRKRRRR